MSIISSFFSVMVCATAALALSACSDAGTDQSTENGDQQAAPSAQTPDTNTMSLELGTAAEPLSESFRASCNNINPDDFRDLNNIHVRCACRKRNSPVFVNAGFDGRCVTVLNNCDGLLVCGNC